jgi:hypothetical protein
LSYFSTMKFVLSICLVLCTGSLFAQAQWQQHVDTKIEVKLDDKDHFLHGFEEFTYINNSPDTLRFIYVHLFPNAYKNDHTPFAKQQDQNHSSDFYYSKKEERGYMDSLQFMANGVSVDHYATIDAPDIARVDLFNPLFPGKQVKITTPFRVKLPKVFSRNGHTGQAYYISQWFPKPAVYDQKGWHPISYLDQGEFYSEYGAYDVTVTLPANYILMATGNCQTDKENAWLDSLAAAPLPSDTLYGDWFPPSAPDMKTVRYKEDNIHDFAWFADKRYIVRKDTVTSPGTGKLITTWTAFMPSFQKKWEHGNQHLAEAVRSYGKRVGPYPYNTIKAVLGDMKAGGGMEYPTITLIDRVASSKLKTVIIHEAGHNWFYGMLGSNERDHPWMDEGLNTFYEQKTTAALSNDTLGKKKNALDESLLYYQMAATNEDQPLSAHSEQFKSMNNYGIDVYYKTALMLRWMEKYMGSVPFEEGMKDYFETWRFHHPYPEDFRAAMQKHTAKSLNWFFDTILTTDRKIDYAITKAKTKEGNTEVTVKNRSGVTGPVYVIAYNKADSITGTAWSEPFSSKTKITIPGTNWSRLRIDDVIPDAHSSNDVYRRHALLHHFGLKLQPALGTNRADKDKVFIAPSLGNNKYDGISVGLLIHNLTIPSNRFAFALAPMFSFNTETFVGAGSIGYSWYPHRTFKEIMLMADAKTFHLNETDFNLKKSIYPRYIKVAPSIQFTFKEKSALSQVTRSLILKGYNINEEKIDYGADSLAIPVLKSQQNMYAGIRYEHQNERMYNPFSYSVNSHGNADFAKLNLEGSVRIDYYARKKALYLRGYLGKFFAINNDPAVTNRYQINASYSGVNDYLYDGTYRGRNVNNEFTGQQISAVQEGGFKVPVFNGAYRTNNWMAAMNLETDLPKINVPIRLFLDAGLIPNPSPGFKNVKSTELLYDAGIALHLSKEVSFYFPLIMSKGFHDYLSNTFGNSKVFARSISFTLELQNVNWLKTPGRLIKKLN